MATRRTPDAPPDPRAVLGRWGEDVAAEHLAARGYAVLSRNWRCPRGELDLVLRAPDGTLVFAEVKTRRTAAFGSPAEAVGPAKSRRLRALACAYVAAERPPAAELRFDVVSIVAPAGSAPTVEHLVGVL